jgi:hypothetical protein
LAGLLFRLLETAPPAEIRKLIAATWMHYFNGAP